MTRSTSTQWIRRNARQGQPCPMIGHTQICDEHAEETDVRCLDKGRSEGIVKLSGIAMIDPQHTGFATGLEPIILGVGQPDSA